MEECYNWWKTVCLMLIITTLLLALGGLIFDVLTPFGTGEWGIYLIPLLLSPRARQPAYPLWFAGLCTVCVVVGGVWSPPGVELEWAWLSRGIGVVVFWLTAGLLMQRRQAERALQIQEQRWRAILDHSPLGIFVKDPAGRYVEFSRQCEIITNQSRAKALGNTDHDIFSPTVAAELVGKDHAVVETGQASQYPLKLVGEGGERAHSVLKFPLFDSQGRCNAICGIVADVTEVKRVERQLQENQEVIAVSNRRLQSLSRRLLELQEAERRHIARELHDEIGQALTALKINLQALQRWEEPDTVASRLLDSVNIVDRTLRQVRNLSLDLRPSMLDDFGLCAALRWYADQQAQRAGLQVHFVAPTLDGRLEPTLETACFRVAQEALTNIVRHARAQRVRVELAEENGFLHLTVRDDGVGFDLLAVHKQLASGTSLGLLGMKERALLMGGRVELKSAPGQGTEVNGWFPMASAAPNGQHHLDLAAK